jgi:hypothetical protein
MKEEYLFMKMFFSVLLLGVVLTGCNQQSGGKESLDAGEAENTLRGFSHALATGDSAALIQMAGPDFVLLEDGRYYDIDATIASINTVFAAGGMMKRTLSDFHTQVREPVAWSRYTVTTEFMRGEDTMHVLLIESAVLEHIAGQWKVEQMATMPSR